MESDEEFDMEFSRSESHTQTLTVVVKRQPIKSVLFHVSEPIIQRRTYEDENYKEFWKIFNWNINF
jgi:hypothetical protein